MVIKKIIILVKLLFVNLKWGKNMENIRRYIAEFIGAFILMFTIACVILLPSSSVIGAIAIGFALMIMVYA